VRNGNCISLLSSAEAFIEGQEMILEQIVNLTRKSVVMRESRTPLSEIEKAASRQTSPRAFVGALQGDDIRLIAEVKRASPSKGLLCANLDAASLARTYTQSGAAAISVLTESEYFLGSYADLDAVRTQVDLPLLCKDFIVDRYQIYEARAHGADAILLIAAILRQVELKALLKTAHSLGMAALVEVHNHDELKRALRVSPGIIGINNRNLEDFSVDLKTTTKQRRLVPSGVVVVSESGIHSHDDVLFLQEAGVNAILVGEALVTSTDPAAKIAELLGSVKQIKRAQKTAV
jgi:indole-3-glycerol phosphate synthase